MGLINGIGYVSVGWGLLSLEVWLTRLIAKYVYYSGEGARPADGRNLVMDRDRRLTGHLRGQTDQVAAPLGFEVNNPWRVSAVLHGMF